MANCFHGHSKDRNKLLFSLFRSCSSNRKRKTLNQKRNLKSNCGKHETDTNSCLERESILKNTNLLQR
ncbi:hypothetical protein P8452_35411 [Trifolium repens]|nr:hypothetical protein P8452_35411 [Trifolium repens]